MIGARGLDSHQEVLYRLHKILWNKTMARIKPKKIIQVPIEGDLLERIDESAGMVAESRAAFIREACRLRLKGLAAKELDRRYVEGYRKKPEDAAWGEMGVKLLAARLAREKW